MLKAVFKYLVVLLLLAGAVFASMKYANREKASYTAPVPSVYVALPSKRTISETASFGAHIEARAAIPVVPLVNGTITKYPARAGDFVKKGELLALIDDSPFRQQMLQAQAAYTGYDSSFKRVSQLYQAGAATKQEFESLQSQRDAARAQYELARLQLDYAKVTAPVSGTILSAPLAVGNLGNTQQPVAVIADLSDLVVRLSVPEKYFNKFVSNQTHISAKIIKERENYADSSTAEEYTATIDTIAPYVDARAKTFEATFKISDAPEIFKPGMYVRIEVSFMQHKNVPSLPITARKTDGSCYVFAADSSADAIQKSLAQNEPVEGQAEHILLTDIISDGEWFVVPSEFADRLFIVEGQGAVFNGQPVVATSLVNLARTGE